MIDAPTDTHRCIDCDALIPQNLDQCDLCWIAERRGMHGIVSSNHPTPPGYPHRMDDPVDSES